jgi:hypothetical protein
MKPSSSIVSGIPQKQARSPSFAVEQNRVVEAVFLKKICRPLRVQIPVPALVSSVLLKALRQEFKGFAILGDGASDVVWNTTLNSGLNLQRYFHIRSEEAC